MRGARRRTRRDSEHSGSTAGGAFPVGPPGVPVAALRAVDAGMEVLVSLSVGDDTADALAGCVYRRRHTVGV